jgi:hypothetical protein
MRGTWSRSRRLAVESCTQAAVTIIANNSPTTLAAMCRLQRLIFLFALIPCSDSLTLHRVLTVCESQDDRGRSGRPSTCDANPVPSKSCNTSPVPSTSYLA